MWPSCGIITRGIQGDATPTKVILASSITWRKTMMERPFFQSRSKPFFLSAFAQHADGHLLLLLWAKNSTDGCSSSEKEGPPYGVENRLTECVMIIQPGNVVNYATPWEESGWIHNILHV